LYTLSYTLATAGAAGLLFSGIYTLVDVYGYRRPTVAMEWMGMHALMIYVLIACNILPIFIHGFYWKEPKNNLVRCCNLTFSQIPVINATESRTRPILWASNELDLMFLCCS
jgi:predicted acyltransferase